MVRTREALSTDRSEPVNVVAHRRAAGGHDDATAVGAACGQRGVDSAATPSDMSSTERRSSTTISVRPSESIACGPLRRAGSAPSVSRPRRRTIARILSKRRAADNSRAAASSTPCPTRPHDHDWVLDLDQAGDLGQDRDFPDPRVADHQRGHRDIFLERLPAQGDERLRLPSCPTNDVDTTTTYADLPSWAAEILAAVRGKMPMLTTCVEPTTTCRAARRAADDCGRRVSRSGSVGDATLGGIGGQRVAHSCGSILQHRSAAVGR